MNGIVHLLTMTGLASVTAWAAVAMLADESRPAGRSVVQSVDASAEASSGGGRGAGDQFRIETLRGRVVWFSEALAKRYDVRTTQDAKERVLALATDDAVIPLIEDRRGRAFRTDERLRDREVELLVRRYRGVPMVQVIRHWTIKPDGKYAVDYWCDVCAISMVEDGPCDCCQAPNVLRERKEE